MTSLTVLIVLFVSASSASGSLNLPFAPDLQAESFQIDVFAFFRFAQSAAFQTQT